MIHEEKCPTHGVYWRQDGCHFVCPRCDELKITTVGRLDRDAATIAALRAERDAAIKAKTDAEMDAADARIDCRKAEAERDAAVADRAELLARYDVQCTSHYATTVERDQARALYQEVDEHAKRLAILLDRACKDRNDWSDVAAKLRAALTDVARECDHCEPVARAALSAAPAAIMDETHTMPRDQWEAAEQRRKEREAAHAATITVHAPPVDEAFSDVSDSIVAESFAQMGDALGARRATRDELANLGAPAATGTDHVCADCGRRWTRPTRCGDCDRNTSAPSPAPHAEWVPVHPSERLPNMCEAVLVRWNTGECGMAYYGDDLVGKQDEDGNRGPNLWRENYTGCPYDPLPDAWMDADMITAALRAAGAPHAEAVTCRVCNDTHAMARGEVMVMCTHCPLPCGKCGRGPFCKTTPCDCECHRAALGAAGR